MPTMTGDPLPRTPLALALVGALALAGCGDGEPDADTGQTEPDATITGSPDPSPSPDDDLTVPDDPATTPEPSPTGADGTGEDVSAIAFSTCEAEDYSIGYPADWNTNDPDGAVDACRVFHPGEIDIEPNQDMDLHYAASVYVDAVAYEDARGGEPGGEVLEERELTVDGHDAFFREVRSDGRALMPEGETSSTYIVDLDGEILVAVTYTIGETDYERDKEILERMVTEELTLTTG